MKFKLIIIISILFMLSCILVGCSDKSSIEPYVGYTPPFLPVKFIISSSGISLAGEASMVTPLGVFSVGANYSLERSADSILVIIRDRTRGNDGFDTIYRVRSGSDEFVAVVNGKTTIQIVERQILIDVSDGSIESIEFKKADPLIEENSRFKEKWNAFWDMALFRYKPFALASWAYDDSTFSKWYGLGFLWFLVRLILAVILLIPDIILTIVLGLGTLFHVFLGMTVRNIFYGLLVLIILFFLWLFFLSY